MASLIALTVIFGFYAVLCCIQLLGGRGADTMTMTLTMAQDAWKSGGLALVRLAAAASLVLAVLATMTLTPLLAFAHVRELVVVVHGAQAGNGNGGGGAGPGAPRLVPWLATATVFVATTALVAAAAVVQLGADGHLDRGRGDVARLNIK